MKRIRFFVFIITLLMISFNISAQDVNQISFLSELDNKSTATYGDALAMFKFQGNEAVSSKKKSANKSESYSLTGYTDSDTLTKGMASLMTAEYLGLGGSFMYMIISTERYAYKACLANGLFSGDGSENDKMTGPELIELFSKISDRKGGE